MSSASSVLSGPATFARGIHPVEHKGLAEDAAIEVVPTPKEVLVPLLQHTGAPCVPTGKPRQSVAIGDVIGDSEAFVSAPIHASVAGKTGKPKVTTLVNGRHVSGIPIKVPVKGDTEQPTPEELWADIFGGPWPKDGLEQHEPEAIVKAVRDAGLVGLGGAAFPTHVKLRVNPEKPIDTLVINGCECEPFLTADYRVMVEAPEPIVTGALLAARALGVARVIIGVEDNKPRAVDTLREAAAGTSAEVAVVRTKYPQGGEKQLIPVVLGREVPTGGLPLDVGVVVMNVGTAAAVAGAVLRGRALTHRVVTVSGAGIVQPKNLLVPIGISYRALIDHCGGLRADAARVVGGGPMMGFALGDLDAPVTKGTSGIVILTAEDTKPRTETSCVRCGRCVDVCPLNLVPSKIALAARNKSWDLARRYAITACMECGCCGYICPAGIPLVQNIRMGKVTMPRE
jgi:electron transport complex protein RnfC